MSHEIWTNVNFIIRNWMLGKARTSALILNQSLHGNEKQMRCRNKLIATMLFHNGGIRQCCRSMPDNPPLSNKISILLTWLSVSHLIQQFIHDSCPVPILYINLIISVHDFHYDTRFTWQCNNSSTTISLQKWRWSTKHLKITRWTF